MTLERAHTISKWTPEEVEEIQYLQRMLAGPAGIASVILVSGKQGTGKTLFITWLLDSIKKYFGMHTITDYPMKDGYGDYEFWDEDRWALEIIYIQEKVKQLKNQGKSITWENVNTKLRMAGIGWDEGHMKLDKRRAGDKMALQYGYLILMVRHFKFIIALTSPDMDVIDQKRVYKFVTHEVGCSFTSNFRGTGIPVCHYKIYNRNTGQSFGKHLYPRNWSDKYDSFGVIVPRAPTITLKDAGLDGNINLEALRQSGMMK
jgi:hypothetical protein